MMQLSTSVVVVLVVLGALGLINGLAVINSPEATNWGNWAADFERCPPGRAAQGFQVKSERGGFIDRTAMNGLRMYCGNPADGVTPSITSNFEKWGDWHKKFRCADQGYLVAFQLRVQLPRLILDEEATTNIRFWCTKNGYQYIEGDGGSKGEWGDVRECAAGEVICGLKTQIQENRGSLQDDTAMNNVAFECCRNPTASL